MEFLKRGASEKLERTSIAKRLSVFRKKNPSVEKNELNLRHYLGVFADEIKIHPAGNASAIKEGSGDVGQRVKSKERNTKNSVRVATTAQPTVMAGELTAVPSPPHPTTTGSSAASGS